MRFQIPEDALTRVRHQVGPTIIEADPGEQLSYIAAVIARLAIERATVPRGSPGEIANARAREQRLPLFGDGDLPRLRRRMEDERTFFIDYWQGRRVKLVLRQEGGVLHLHMPRWAERWGDGLGNNIQPYMIAALREMLEAAAAEIAQKG